MFPGNKFVIVLLTSPSWILTQLEGMSWSEDFNSDVSVSSQFISMPENSNSNIIGFSVCDFSPVNTLDTLLTSMKYFQLFNKENRFERNVTRCKEPLGICKIHLYFQSLIPFLSTYSGRNTSGSHETKQWQEMIAKPRQPAVVWHRWWCMLSIEPVHLYLCTSPRLKPGD